MLKKISIAIVVLLAGFFVYVGFQPSEFLISRQILINAPADVIFPHINHSEKADAWMPWKEIDSDLVMTYSGPVEGVGSTSSWVSDGDMGVGSAEVIESHPNTSVKTKLTYTKPMQMTQISDITLQTTEGGTLVTWSVSGRSNYLSKLMCVFMNMDEVVGGYFEDGLATLKSTIEVK